MEQGISVIMPAYDEEAVLSDAVAMTADTFRSVGVDFEIILVNDGSTDGTGAIIDRLAALYPYVIGRHQEKNQGIGRAVHTGADAASKEYLLLIPADNPISPEELSPFLDHLGSGDVIMGVRPERVGYPLVPRAASWIYSRVFVPVLFGVHVSDVNWIQLWRTEAFRKGYLKITCKGMMFLLELAIRAQRNGLVVREVPLAMRPRENRTPSCFRVSFMWRTFVEMLDLFRRVRFTGL
jgi:glycosyltransferase involved in cell wall biosynthesis